LRVPTSHLPVLAVSLASSLVNKNDKVIHSVRIRVPFRHAFRSLNPILVRELVKGLNV